MLTTVAQEIESELVVVRVLRVPGYFILGQYDEQSGRWVLVEMIVLLEDGSDRVVDCEHPILRLL